MIRQLTLATAILFFVVMPAPGQTSLWIDPTAIDLTRPEVVKTVLEQPVGRLIVHVFSGGELMFSSKLRQFRQPDEAHEKALDELLKAAKKRKREVFVSVDLLHWTYPATARERDVLEQHKELAERDREGSCGVPADGKYASPFNPKVRAILKTLIQQTAERFPQADGVLLRCRLPLGTLLGYSDSARATYIRAKQIDPMDISISEGNLMTEWVGWRLNQMKSLVTELSSIYKKQNPRGKVACLGYANWYRISLGARNTSLEDWLSWTLGGAVDELVLDCRWDAPANKDALGYSRSLLAKAKITQPLSLLLTLREGEQWLDPQSSLAKSGRDKEGIIIRVSREEDLARLQKFLVTLPEPSATTPHSDAYELANDPALQVKITLRLKSPTVPEVVELLSKATGLSLTLSENVDRVQPAFGTVIWTNVPLWSAMKEVAESAVVQGAWTKEGDGYRLHCNRKNEERVAKTGLSLLQPWMLGCLLALLAVVGILAVVALLRKRKATS